MNAEAVARCGDHSSRSRLAARLQQPTRGSKRAGLALPSYLALHHAGFSVPPMLPSERWALTPPFHPYRNARAKRRRLAGLPASCHRAAHSGGLSFCGTIREQQRKLSLAVPLPWRYQARCPFLPAPTLRPALRRWCPDFPPALLQGRTKVRHLQKSQRSPGSPATSYYRTLRAGFAAIESPHPHRLWRNIGGEMGGRRHRGGGGTSLPTSTQILIMIGVLIVLVVLLGTILFFQAR
jgi:hypothetical protein